MLVVGLAASIVPWNAAALTVSQLLVGLGGGAAAGTIVGLLPELGPWRHRATVALLGLAVVALVVGFLLGWVVPVRLNWRLLYLLAFPPALIAGLVTLAGGIARLASRPAR